MTTLAVDMEATSDEYQAAIAGTDSLLERTYAGVSVEVRWVTGTEHLLLCLSRGEERYATVIAGTDAQDAFDHPYPYLAKGKVEFSA